VCSVCGRVFCDEHIGGHLTGTGSRVQELCPEHFSVLASVLDGLKTTFAMQRRE